VAELLVQAAAPGDEVIATLQLGVGDLN